MIDAKLNARVEALERAVMEHERRITRLELELVAAEKLIQALAKEMAGR